MFRFASAYTKAREFFEKPDRAAKVEETLRKLCGQPYTVRFEEDATAVVADVPVGTSARPKVTAKEDAERVPLVRRAVEVLGASIQRVEDGFGDAEGG